MEPLLADPVHIERNVDLRLSQSQLKLFQVEARLILVDWIVDDARGKNGTWKVVVDQSAIHAAVAERLDCGRLVG